jgi:hypothetical protein
MNNQVAFERLLPSSGLERAVNGGRKQGASTLVFWKVREFRSWGRSGGGFRNGSRLRAAFLDGALTDAGLWVATMPEEETGNPEEVRSPARRSLPIVDE